MQSVTQRLAVVCLLAVVTLVSAQTTQCKPEVNCSPPNCRCWQDRTVPGNIPVSSTPQIVLLTFENFVNDSNVALYLQLFEGTNNPNGCPVVGTFYVQDNGTDYGVVRQLYDSGHEIGVTSVDGTLPLTATQWKESLEIMRFKISNLAAIPNGDVMGIRAPGLKPGGLSEWVALSQSGFLYDSSCSTTQFDDQVTFLWPYTYDYAPGPTCLNGEGPELPFEGKWQMLIPDLEFNGTKCVTPSACENVISQKDAFDLFYNNFILHYQGGRTPFMIALDSDWASVDFKREGTRQFLEYIRAAFEDTWILSAKRTLEWIQNPVTHANATAGYQPWSC